VGAEAAGGCDGGGLSGGFSVEAVAAPAARDMSMLAKDARMSSPEVAAAAEPARTVTSSAGRGRGAEGWAVACVWVGGEVAAAGLGLAPWKLCACDTPACHSCE
jgi:hypothetical protein